MSIDTTQFDRRYAEIRRSLETCAASQHRKAVLECGGRRFDVQERLHDRDEHIVDVDGVVDFLGKFARVARLGRELVQVELRKWLGHKLAPSSLAGTESVGRSSAADTVADDHASGGFQ